MDIPANAELRAVLWIVGITAVMWPMISWTVSRIQRSAVLHAEVKQLRKDVDELDNDFRRWLAEWK